MRVRIRDLCANHNQPLRNARRAGIIPDLDRGRAFVVIFVMCAFHIIAKAVATALLAVTSSFLLLGYIVADHALHWVYRITRADFVYFPPLPLAVSYTAGAVIRVITKVITDFTGERDNPINPRRESSAALTLLRAQARRTCASP